MTTIKSYTDIKQSKKLAEILPLESADMHYWRKGQILGVGHSKEMQEGFETKGIDYTPCWSLAALFSILPDGTDIIKEEADTENEKYMCTVGAKDDIISTFGNNPVDACYEMIIKLHELNLL